ncbi:hypothetical protein EAH79_14805 [Sphingomonas koreensis]|nr:hypothetical protein EAH79_14805 [Sphingomonas koreensis]
MNLVHACPALIEIGNGYVGVDAANVDGMLVAENEADAIRDTTQVAAHDLFERPPVHRVATIDLAARARIDGEFVELTVVFERPCFPAKPPRQLPKQFWNVLRLDRPKPTRDGR